MKDALQIHETAFVTATYRASDEALSKDVYSSYWKNEKTDQWIANYLENVSPEESFTHCLRNRYFYEVIKGLKAEHQIEVLINFGCGFSMYPFLFEDDLIHIEIDQQDVISYKKQEVQNLIASGKLPKREIHYIAKDFNLEKEELTAEIKSITKGRPSFVLIEGVLFFLSKSVADELFALIREIQTPGSYLGSVSFLDEIEQTDVFQRLIDSFNKDMNLEGEFNYLTLPTRYYESLPSYDLIEHEDYVSLSKQYSPNKIIEDGNSILNEHMYLLKRQ